MVGIIIFIFFSLLETWLLNCRRYKVVKMSQNEHKVWYEPWTCPGRGRVAPLTSGEKQFGGRATRRLPHQRSETRTKPGDKDPPRPCTLDRRLVYQQLLFSGDFRGAHGASQLQKHRADTETVTGRKTSAEEPGGGRPFQSVFSGRHRHVAAQCSGMLTLCFNVCLCLWSHIWRSGLLTGMISENMCQLCHNIYQLMVKGKII